jgi:hypothetical protein
VIDIGEQIISCKREPVSLQIRTEPTPVNKVELTFFLDNFNKDKKIEFLIRMDLLNDDQEENIGILEI